ncbi:MAG: phenylacetaldehyde dehydrogenase [Pseudonocardiales bacterium]|jgi:succinate-semialdehyde dehydrogenase/glutarate-semialdehyde dehydrogenase|nr:phenylacetaldehyde dehydrogenase [Pseudonocardiales bacterium]
MTTLTIRAPDDHRVLGYVGMDDSHSITRKVEAAAAAMPQWLELRAVDRGAALHSIAAAVRAEMPTLSRALAGEQGKTVREAELELDRFAGPFDQYAGLIDAVNLPPVVLGEGTFGHVERNPVGVAAGIVPWNFPASLYASKLAPALAAGCGFLIKPAETTSLITARLTDLVRRFVPDGLVDVVIGGAEAGTALVAHPSVARVAFTGSTAVGRRIAALAADGIKRVTLELGGCDPYVVRADADLPAAVRGLMGTRFYNAGQVCVAPKRLVVHRAVADEMIAMLESKVARIRPGPSLDPDSTMGPLHTEAGRAALDAQVGDAVSRGAKLVGGGRSPHAHGWFVLPALLLDPPEGARVRTEETFGPVLTVLRADDDDHAVALATETPYGLGASVWSADVNEAFELARRIPAGYTWINRLGRVYDELPFGGVGVSGLGREHGVEALHSYLEDRSFVYPRATGVA